MTARTTPVFPKPKPKTTISETIDFLRAIEKGFTNQITLNMVNTLKRALPFSERAGELANLLEKERIQ